MFLKLYSAVSLHIAIPILHRHTLCVVTPWYFSWICHTLFTGQSHRHFDRKGLNKLQARNLNSHISSSGREGFTADVFDDRCWYILTAQTWIPRIAVRFGLIVCNLCRTVPDARLQGIFSLMTLCSLKNCNCLLTHWRHEAQFIQESYATHPLTGVRKLNIAFGLTKSKVPIYICGSATIPQLKDRLHVNRYRISSIHAQEFIENKVRLG